MTVFIKSMITIFATISSYLVAFNLRFDFDYTRIYSFNFHFITLSILSFSRYLAYIRLNINNSMWSFTSTKDVIQIVKAHTFSSIILAFSIYILGITGYPRSIIIIELLFSIFFIGAFKVIYRQFRKVQFSKYNANVNLVKRKVIVIGAGDSANFLLRSLVSYANNSYIPIGIFDDNVRLHGSNISGIKVVGKISDIRTFVEKYQDISLAFLAIPRISKEKLSEIYKICEGSGIILKRLKQFEDIAYYDALSGTNDSTIESLLDRDVNIEKVNFLDKQLEESKVLITGAGGSIGSEIVRQVMTYRPKKVLLLDSSEYNLFKIEQELRNNFSSLKVEYQPLLVNIANYNEIRKVIKEFSPDIVYHAAAYKHVPILEANPHSAFVNNILGTSYLLKSLSEIKPCTLVFISTDKAVSPTSFMGLTKLLCEKLICNFALINSEFKISTVRFGNVINSNGSVIPYWKEQILKGESLSITHPDMERYFMSIREAVKLVMISGARGESGKIYVLDMGEPVKIVKVAKKMLALYGRRDLEIKITGIRPGEKLIEELHSNNEELKISEFDQKISFIDRDNYFFHGLEDKISNIEKELFTLDNEELKFQLFQIIYKLDNKGEYKIGNSAM